MKVMQGTVESLGSALPAMQVIRSATTKQVTRWAANAKESVKFTATRMSSRNSFAALNTDTAKKLLTEADAAISMKKSTQQATE